MTSSGRWARSRLTNRFHFTTASEPPTNDGNRTQPARRYCRPLGYRPDFWRSRVFWIVLYLLRYVHGASGALVLFFSLWGFMIGGCYGDSHSPSSADRFLAQEHLRAVATGCAAGII